MIIDMSYWTRVFKRIVYVILILIGLYLAFKLSIFYLPFLIAFIISLIMEPAIKFLMKKIKITRRLSAIILFIIVSLIILGALSWGIVTLISEASNLLDDLNFYVEKIYKLHLPAEVKEIFNNSTGSVIETITNWIRNFLNSLMGIVTSIPNIAIYFAITVMALYFMCVDKIYILDQIEHHLPKIWVMKLGRHMRELIKTLGNYLKAEATLVLVSFIISVIGLYILSFAGFKIEFPLLIALGIGFVDALPILGSGTVMVPWAVICALNGELNLGIAIIVLFIIMSIVRQFLEPRLVSKNIGVHPIFTLLAMYTGFKIIGILGLLIGPIVLIIFKNIFASLIEQGVMKTIFDKN